MDFIFFCGLFFNLYFIKLGEIMELIINIEKVVINSNGFDKNLNGLIAKDVVEFISSVINKEEKENKNLKNMGVCQSGQMPIHTHNHK